MGQNIATILLGFLVVQASGAATSRPVTHFQSMKSSPGATLLVALRTGYLTIKRGTDLYHIRMSYSAEYRNKDTSDRVYPHFQTSDSLTAIILVAPYLTTLHVTLEVPSPLTLKVKMFAGDINVEGIEGNKDINLSIGDLRLSVEQKKACSNVSASVSIGEIYGFPGGVHGLIGQHGRLHGDGLYELSAHLRVGEIYFSFE